MSYISYCLLGITIKLCFTFVEVVTRFHSLLLFVFQGAICNCYNLLTLPSNNYDHFLCALYRFSIPCLGNTLNMAINTQCRQSASFYLKICTGDFLFWSPTFVPWYVIIMDYSDWCNIITLNFFPPFIFAQFSFSFRKVCIRFQTGILLRN